MRPVNIPHNDILTGIGYGASSGSILFGLLNTFTYEQWNAIGVIGGLFIGIATFITNLYYRRKADRRASARDGHQ